MEFSDFAEEIKIAIDADDEIFLVNKSALELLENDASKLIGTKIFGNTKL